jgi:hypothetical protein
MYCEAAVDTQSAKNRNNRRQASPPFATVVYATRHMLKIKMALSFMQTGQ